MGWLKKLWELLFGKKPVPPPVEPPPVEPEPEPEPTPVPEPTPSGPICHAPELVEGCWHRPPGEDWQYIPVPPPPPPDPERYEMGNYWLYQHIADATPKQCGFKRCEKAGFPGRQCCPAAPEDDPTRLEKEQAMMGGPRPLWTLQVFEGKLGWEYIDDWKARVYGSGKGRLRAEFPNGKAVGDWLEVEL